VSIATVEELRDVTEIPGNAARLEWSTLPPPAWNFAILPRVAERDGYWSTKLRAHAMQDQAKPAREYRADRNAEKQRHRLRQRVLFAVVSGFAADLAHLVDGRVGLLGAFVTLLAFAFRDKEEVEISASKFDRFERGHQAEVAL